MFNASGGFASTLSATSRILEEPIANMGGQWSQLDLRLNVMSVIYSVGALCLCSVILRSGRRGSKLPPGPPTVPIFGNMLQMNSYVRLSDWNWFQDLRKTFGPIMSIKLGNKTAIVLQDDGTAMRELFEKRGALYSVRPKNTVSEFIGSQDHPLFEQDHHKVRLNRKLIVQHFSSEKSRTQHVLIQQAESTQLLNDCLDQPEDYEKHLMRFTVSSLLSVAYGYRTPVYEHLGVVGIQIVMNRWLEQYRWDRSPPVDIWPWLNRLPDWLSPWRKGWLKVRTYLDKVYGDLMQRSRELDDEGRLDGSFAHKLFVEQETHGLSEHMVQSLLGVVLEGGSDILCNAICVSLLCLLKHPEVQIKAQQEIDSLCDEDTLPDWSHYKTMPYVRSVGKESMRWRPLFPLGVPRQLEQDDTYGGYHLPKKSMVASSIWVIHQNPDRYPDPERFMPERFLNHDLMTGEYLSHPDHHDRDHYSFGSGRRSCPGIFMAEQAMFLCISKILWAFDIKPKPGVDISEIDTDFHSAFVGAAMRKPKPFPMVLQPRSDARVRTMKRELALLQDGFFKKYAGGEGLPIPQF